MSARFRKMSPGLGVEVTDLDLASPLSDETFAALRAAWLDADGVMVIRNQQLTPAQHIAFGRRFGDLYSYADSNIANYTLPGFPEIYRVSNKVVEGKPVGRKDAGTYWHSDQSPDEAPPSASILHAIEIPPIGGDTMFANQYLAYQALSGPMKQLLEPLKAVHSRAGARGTSYKELLARAMNADEQRENAHPVVRTHGETGRKSLFINPGFTTHIEGLTDEESDAILAFLFAHVASPEFVYRHVWQPNDMVIWDNRSVLHYAVSNYAGLGDRLMHRVTVRGEVPA